MWSESTIKIVMASYAILRVAKLKTNTAVKGSIKHAFRAQNTPNADPSRARENTHIGAGDVTEAMEAYKSKLPDKIRANGVRCLEYLITGSPERMAEMNKEAQDAYFAASLDWLKEKHGAENVVYAGIHRDETTPHMYAYVVPLDERGKLNARHFIGGTKHALTDMQTDFAEKVGKPHGLERGVEGSKAKHERVSQFYANLAKPTVNIPTISKIDPTPAVLKKPNFFSKGELESPESVQKRVNKAVAEFQDKANEVMQWSTDKARNATRRANRAEEELATIPKFIRELPKEIMNILAGSALRLTLEHKALKENQKWLREQKRDDGGR